MAKLAFIIGYGASTLPLLSKVLLAESNEHKFEFVITNDEQAQNHLEFLRTADAIFIYSNAVAPHVEDAIAKSRASVIISASRSCSYLSRCRRSSAAKAAAFYKFGGDKNLIQLVHLLLKEIGFNIEVAEPEEIPWHGIWHPEVGTFTTVSEYLEKYANGSKPLVGILFYRPYWLYGNCSHVKSLIKSLENENLGVIPVFTYAFGDPNLGEPTAEDSIRKFFISNGKPLIHALINLTSFFLLNHKTTAKDFFACKALKAVEGVELLKKLNVPVIQAVYSLNKSVEEWKSDPEGIDYLSQVHQVIMPEVDGLIEPIYLAGSKIFPDGVKTYEAFEEHSRYIAKRVRKWVELRRKHPEERKIAIVLINPPCKGLEGNVAVGFGLDVPESVVRLLHVMKSFGYRVGDGIPKDGRELIKMIMERKAINEFRWTSINEIVEKGGAVGFVDSKTYMEWFNELPTDVKSKMIEDWGHPEDVLYGKGSNGLVGMVYNGKFVVPGVVFGNILITPQPKFGCAGPRCDGEVCRILHDPTITPPHQWLAAYRWITRVFKADLIVHFGTHGSLEFRPGKGVGLSPSCWPEISVDDAPHLYVYIVSNPMEGVIAKRRSYATILDHIYPPMMMANVLDEINQLLAEYSKAKQLGDHARAKVIYENLLKKAKENNIPFKSSGGDGVIEEVHRFVSVITSTQIENGLHIFGYPPEDPAKLAEYVATIMSHDTYTSKSIRRSIAEYLGLNYDEIKERAQEINKLGLTNHQTLQVLHKVAANVLKRLIELKVQYSALTEETLRSLLDEEIERVLGGGTAVKVRS